MAEKKNKELITFGGDEIKARNERIADLEAVNTALEFDEAYTLGLAMVEHEDNDKLKENITELESRIKTASTATLELSKFVFKIQEDRWVWLSHKERLMSERDVLEKHFTLFRNCSLYPSHCGHCGVSDCKLNHINDNK
jgi:hypothetical protein